MTNHIDIVRAWVEVAVDCWHKDQAKDLSRYFYAYFRAGNVVAPGSIVIAEEPLNEHYSLISGERISPYKTPHEIKTRLMALCRGLPLLKIEE